METFLSEEVGAFLKLVPWTAIEWVLVLSALLVFALQLWYYLGFYRGIPRWAKRLDMGIAVLNDEKLPVSVVITANNQQKNLIKNLPFILEQDYPEFQVVVVDDASDDESSNVLGELCKKYPHLYHTFVPQGVQNISARKIALTVGIKAAKYEVVLFTDANCKPVSNQWIKSIMRQFTPETEVVLSYSRYGNLKGLWANLITYDNLFKAVRYLGMASSGKPYMGVGQNMAYRKALFFEQRGFASHLKLNNGEDDLFVSEIAKRTNTRIEVSSDAIIQIETMHPIELWIDHRINRLHTSSYYKPSSKYLHGTEIITRFLSFALFFALLAIGLTKMDLFLILIGSVLFLTRLIVQVTTINACASTLNEKKFYFLVPIFDFVLPLYSLFQRIEGLLLRRRKHSHQILH